MANIVLTDSCNLKCPYCFANEFVNKHKNEISMENFKTAVDFILSSGETKFGLIGGEPTLHRDFGQILTYLINDKRLRYVNLYTNAVYADKYFNELQNAKFHLLINCNSPEDIGQSSFDKYTENIGKMLLERHMKDQMCLGINLYKPDQDYGFLLKLLEQYKQNKVRISITVPNDVSGRNKDAFEYFRSMKGLVVRFICDAVSLGAVPHFDCNKIPGCLIDDNDIKAITDSFEKAHIKLKNVGTVFKNVRCSPVIDIRQDLSAIRCFGLSEYTKTDIRDFANFKELERYYENEIDAFAFWTSYDSKCADCFERKTKHCNGGCLAFKIDSILKMKEYATEMMVNGNGK